MLATILLWMIWDALLLASFFWLPVMRGEDAFFGVRVDADFYRGEGRKLVRRYWFWLAMLFVEIEAIGILVSIYRAELPFARAASMPLLVLPAIILYIVFYREVKPFAASDMGQRFASALRRRHLSEYTNLYLEAAVALLTVLPSLFLIYYYPRLPERIPVHWDWRGRPDSWARKTPGAVFYLSTLLIYMQGLFLLIKHGLTSVKMTLPSEQTQEYLSGKEDFLNVTMKLLDWVRVMTALLLGALLLNIVFSSVEHLRFLTSVVAVVAALDGFVLAGVCIFFTYRLFKIDRRLKRTVGRVYVQRERDARHWYAGGLFYYNPDDPALFVEKMVGFGYTFNMANRRVYVYLAYMLVLPLIISWMLKS